jgi:hypothetical protein
MLDCHGDATKLDGARRSPIRRPPTCCRAQQQTVQASTDNPEVVNNGPTEWCRPAERPQ